MKFRDLFRKKVVEPEVRSSESTLSLLGGSLMYNGTTSYTNNKALMHSCVFRCVDVLSNSIAQLPVVVNKVDENGYKTPDNTHVVFSLLNKRPNGRQDKNTFLRAIIMNMLLNGNGYARIIRDTKGNITELQYIPSDMVTVYARDVFSEVVYQVSQLKEPVKASDMLHFKNIIDRDGIRGISTLAYAKKVLTLGFDELDTADAFFRSGGNKAGVLKTDRPITDEQEQQILSRWQQTFNQTNGIPNGVCLLKPGLDYTPITTSPADAELLESRKFSVQEIARFFGVPLSMLLDNSNNSYSSVEAENLSFLTNTLSPMIEKIETELNNKLWTKPEEMQGYQVRFDTNMLLRTDKAALAEYYTKLFNLSVMSPNEIRREFDLPPIEGGDEHFMQVNISTISKIVNQDLQDNENISNQLKTNEEDN